MKYIFRHCTGSISLILSLLTMVLAGQSVMAEDSFNLSNVKFEIVCEDTVEMGKKFHMGYVLDYGDLFDPESLELKIPNFETDCAKLLYVGKTGTSTSHSIVNGKVTTTHKVKWDAIVRAIKEGSFQTPDVSLLYQNNPLDISPEPKTIVISKKANLPTTNKQENDTVIKIPDNAIIRLETNLDKRTINLGDSVLLQVKLQSNQSFNQVRFDGPLEIEDCFCENIEKIAGDPIQTIVDGVECYEWIIAEYRLTPLKSGVIVIPEIKIKGNCSIRKDEQDSFWGSLPKYHDVPFQSHSNVINLKVK